MSVVLCSTTISLPAAVAQNHKTGKHSKLLEKNYHKPSNQLKFKNELIKAAKSSSKQPVLDASQSNPNWVALEPRNSFLLFRKFALKETKRSSVHPGFGGFAKKNGIWKRFQNFLKNNSKHNGSQSLHKMFSYVADKLKYPMDDFTHEMVNAVCGYHYPKPERMLNYSEKIVQKYLRQEMYANKNIPGSLDLFATEGSTAAISYIFHSLIENKLLTKGDKVALGIPIFTPYLEILNLNDLEFVELKIFQDENSNWQYSNSEIEKLADPNIKAFLLVNPSNPTSSSIDQKALNKIANLVKTKRPDLMIITDDVYGTFTNNFRSLIYAAPHNTILIYSFSKYFGATGWRLGIIGICDQNIFDKKIAALPKKEQTRLNNRYSTVTAYPDKMKFIDRIVADSRSAALYHTAGLSTPQQAMMTFFALSCLTDQQNDYKKKMLKL